MGTDGREKVGGDGARPASDVTAILDRFGIDPGGNPFETLERTLEDLFEFRGAHEAPGWSYRGGYSEGAHHSDAVVASRVRMLDRHSIDHESVCVMARDRIRDLSRAIGQANARLVEAGLKPEKVGSED